MFSTIRAAAAAACLFCSVTYGIAGPQSTSDPRLTGLELAKNLGDKLPLAFEQNRGQANPAVKYLARGAGYQVFLTAEEAVIVLAMGEPARAPAGPSPVHAIGSPQRDAAVIRMRFEGANPEAAIKGEELLAHKTNYLVSADAREHITGVANHAKVKYEAVYPGIDVVYYGNRGLLEYDMLVAPGAKPDRIRISFLPARKLSVSSEGELVLDTPRGDIRYQKPVAYQDFEGRRTLVDAEYLLAENGQVGFRVGAYDPTRPLVIDPILSYSSFLWGLEAKGVAVDATGNAYVVGSTWRSDLPSVGGYLTRLSGSQDAYVAKLSPSGNTVFYATYLGARREQTQGFAIAVNASGEAHVGGTVSGSGYPVTAGAYQTTWAPGSSFLTKLNAAGDALVYSTYVQGANIAALALGADGSVYTTGTAIDGLVTTAGAFQPTRPATSSSASFVAKLNPAGSAMSYATFLAGDQYERGEGIAVDTAGNAYVTGYTYSAAFPTLNPIQASRRGFEDAFVTKMNPTGTGLVYSTYLGGSDTEYGRDIAVDSFGQAIVGGQTRSNDFSVTAGAYQTRKGSAGNYANGFVVKFNAAGTGLVFGTYLGGSCTKCSDGSDGDGVEGVAIDAAGYIYLGGFASSFNFPLVDALQGMPPNGGNYQRVAFAAKIKPSGNGLVYSTPLGGVYTQDARLGRVAVDGQGGSFAVAGSIPFDGFPVTPGAQVGSNSTAIVKFSPGAYPTVVNSSANPAGASQAIVLTAQSQLPASGTITFHANGTPLGSAPVTDGAATLSVTLAPGIHRITAAHSVDGKLSPPLYQLVGGQD